jgi:hypothetical protein
MHGPRVFTVPPSVDFLPTFARALLDGSIIPGLSEKSDPLAFGRATIYVPTGPGVRVMDDLAKKGVPEVWLNPGADDRQVVEKARQLGLKTVQHCSIIAIGDSPANY